MRLIEIINKKKLQVNLSKVKAHSGVIFNEQADKLAKEGKNFPEIIWKEPRRPLWSVLPTWNQSIIDISLREFTKEFHKKETTIEWSQQRRIQNCWSEEIEEQSNYSWDKFWKLCRQGSSSQTSIKQAKERSFRIKLMNDELPTLSNLQKRKPNIYKETICPICKEKKEDIKHIFECSSSLNTRLQIWTEIKRKVKTKYHETIKRSKKRTNKENTDPVNLIQLIDQWETQSSNSSQELINLSLGLFDDLKRKAWNDKAKKDGLKSIDGQAILNLISCKFLRLIRKKIWIPRCEKIIAWENTQGIGRTEKRRKKENRKIPRKGKGIKDQQTPCAQEYQEEREEDTSDHLKEVETLVNPNNKNKTSEVVWNWIKEGKKWLGL
jgi:hypothetical protein